MAIPVKRTPTKISLAQELASIDNQNKITQIQPWNAQTIDVFWTKFIEPLPNKAAVLKWFKLLCDYVDQDDAVFAIRCYGNWESYKIKDDYTLRRGFYNLTDKDYSFFYTDNFFAAYFAKMAVDNYVPTLSEFNAMMHSREFPARFGRSAAVERDKAAYSIDGKKGKNPGFTTNGYKIAHVVDSGKRIFNNGQETTIGQICDKYCSRGDYNDWTPHNDSFGDFYARDLKMDPDARELIVAHFLRFACPMNYIFTPKKTCHTLGVKVYMNDIAECNELQQYAMQQFHIRYGKDYEDFLNRIMLPPDLNLKSLPPIAALGAKNIAINYGYNINTNSGSSPKTKAKTKITIKKTKHVTSMSKIRSKDILAKLRSLQAVGTLPPSKAVILTNKTSFGRYLSSVPEINNGYDPYMKSIETPEFNALLLKHRLPGDIYLCRDLDKLIDVLDELVNNPKTPQASAALEYRKQSCRPNLCYFLRYLLQGMGIII